MVWAMRHVRHHNEEELVTLFAIKGIRFRRQAPVRMRIQVKPGCLVRDPAAYQISVAFHNLVGPRTVGNDHVTVRK